MLKYRLISGAVMTLFFTAVVVLDGWFDGSLCRNVPHKAVQGTGFCILAAAMIILAQREMAKLVLAKGLKIFLPVSIPASILLATGWYWSNFTGISQGFYLNIVLAFTFLAIALYHYTRYGISGFLANSAINLFSVIYLGIFAGFIVGIRVNFGLWPLLIFIFVVKFSDIGAYAIGHLFGRHKFSPKVSPGKTWEGMGGAILAAVLMAVVFAENCAIIKFSWRVAVIFGLCFAVIGQFSDLLESLIKRDAEKKDSSTSVPGFGGILDVIDSPLAASVFAYLFFYVYYV